MYTNYEILLIFKNCHSVSELAKAALVFLSLIEDGEVNEQQKSYINHRIEIRKRQF